MLSAVMVDKEYERRIAVQRLNADMELIERQRRRARACDTLLHKINGSLRKVEMRVGARIVAWFTPTSKGEWKEMQLTDEEVEQLKVWLEDHALGLRRHADSLEAKRAGVE